MLALLLLVLVLSSLAAAGSGAPGLINVTQLNLKFSASEVEREISVDMSENLKGSTCRWSFRGDRKERASDAVVTYQNDVVDAQEWVEYASFDIASTKANSHILTGLYQGLDQLSGWRRSKRMHFAVPRSHPRNADREACISLAESAVRRPTKAYLGLEHLSQPEYLIEAKNALVNSIGVVALQCGYWQGHESCLTNIKSAGRNWRKACNDQVPPEKWSRLGSVVSSIKLGASLNLSSHENRNIYRCFFEARELGLNASYFLTNPRRTNRLFLMTAAWDYNYHHYTFEGLLRLYRHVDFLRENKDILIHQQAEDAIIADRTVSCSSCRQMREHMLEFFNISKRRIIRGVVYAKQVYLPRGTHCSSPFHHAVSLRKLAKTMIGIAFGLSSEKVRQSTLLEVQNMLPKFNRPVVLIQNRKCVDEDDNTKNARYTARCDERSWNETFFRRFVDEVNSSFGETHDVWIHQSSETLAAQIKLHASADIVFGLHGAGLTNVMFVRPGGLLVEIVGFWDGRILPLCGHYGPFASVFNINHLIHNFDSSGKFMTFDVKEVVSEAKSFFAQVH